MVGDRHGKLMLSFSVLLSLRTCGSVSPHTAENVLGTAERQERGMKREMEERGSIAYFIGC